MSNYKLSKEELIDHCERCIRREEKLITIRKSAGMDVSTKILEEHEIFLRLLKGENVDKIFEA